MTFEAHKIMSTTNMEVAMVLAALAPAALAVISERVIGKNGLNNWVR